MDINNLKQLLTMPIVFQDIHLDTLDIENAVHTPDFNLPLHRHALYEFSYVHSGRFITSMDGVEFATSAGECMLIPQGKLHSNRFDIPDDGFCIRFSLHKEPNAKGSGFYEELISIINVPRAYSFKLNISPLLEYRSFYSIQVAFMDLLFNMYELFNPNPTVIKPSKSELTNLVITYLNENYKNKIYVSDIAKVLNVSYSTLSRNFKAATGLTIIEKLTDIRISAAKPLLLDSKYTASQIANMVGFENEYYFSKAFKQSAGVTPSNFRKRIIS